MTLQKIKTLAPPPVRPLFDGAKVSWEQIQTKIGVRLPRFLDEFARCYGSGRFEADASPLCVYNPYDPRYQFTVKQMLDVYTTLRRDTPQYSPYNCYPEPHGLYPIAYGEQGIQFHIIMEEDPDDYLLIHDCHSTFTEYPGQTFFPFFLDYLCNKIEPDPMFPNPIVFDPEPL